MSIYVKHLTISQCPSCDATTNGDCPNISLKLTSAPELCKHLTISQCPCLDAKINGDCPNLSHKLGFSNNLDMVELILKYIDPKCIDMEYTYYGKSFCTRYTPLTLPSELGNLGIVKALLRNVNHVDINKCNDWEESPLILASGHGHCDIVKFCSP
jgi:hypothetical protein